MFKIFVGNLSFETTEEKLRKVFQPHLDIEDLVIARETESGKSKGYAFVMTRDPIRGRRAIMQIGKFFVDGRLAYIKEAHGKKQPVKGRRRPARVSHRPKPIRRRMSGGGPARGGGGYSPVARQNAEPLSSRGYVGMDEQPSTSPPGNASSEQSPRQG